MSKFNRWWSSQDNHDAASKDFARRVWQAAITSVAAPMPPTPSQQEALNDVDNIIDCNYDIDNVKERLKAFILARPEGDNNA